MAVEKINWAGISKVLLDASVLFVFGTPAIIASYIWQAVNAGWAFGEWAFDPESFDRRYGGCDKTKELLRELVHGLAPRQG